MLDAARAIHRDPSIDLLAEVEQQRAVVLERESAFVHPRDDRDAAAAGPRNRTRPAASCRTSFCASGLPGVRAPAAPFASASGRRIGVLAFRAPSTTVSNM